MSILLAKWIRGVHLSCALLWGVFTTPVAYSGVNNDNTKLAIPANSDIGQASARTRSIQTLNDDLASATKRLNSATNFYQTSSLLAALLGACAAFFGVLAIFANGRIVQSSREQAKAVNAISGEKDRSFEQYKERISVRVADANKAGIEAGRAANDAILKAAQMEREAAAARLETERLKASVAWRQMGPETMLRLVGALQAKPGKVNLLWTDGDPESLYFSIQIGKALTDAGWQVAPNSYRPTNTVFLGIDLTNLTGPDAQTLVEAFASAGLKFAQIPLPESSIGFSQRSYVDGPIIFIGSRPIAFMASKATQ